MVMMLVIVLMVMMMVMMMTTMITTLILLMTLTMLLYLCFASSSVMISYIFHSPVVQIAVGFLYQGVSIKLRGVSLSCIMTLVVFQD